MDIFASDSRILGHFMVVLLHCEKKRKFNSSLILKYNKLWKTQLMQKCSAHD